MNNQEGQSIITKVPKIQLTREQILSYRNHPSVIDFKPSLEIMEMMRSIKRDAKL